MISNFLSVVIIVLMVVLVVYPAFHLLRQTWMARQRRSRLENRVAKRPQ